MSRRAKHKPDEYKDITMLFMKESVRALMGEDFRQEFPWV